MLVQVQVLLVSLYLTTTPSSVAVSASPSELDNIFNLDGQIPIDDIPIDVIDAFKSKEGLKINYDIIMQYISADNTVMFQNGIVVSLDGLFSEEVITPTATCTENGVSVPCPPPVVFVKYDDENHLRVQVNKDENGKIVSITLRAVVIQDGSSEPTPMLETLEAVTDGVFTSLTGEAFDDDIYNKFELRSAAAQGTNADTNNVVDVQVDNMKRQLRQRINNEIRAQEQEKKQEDGLQEEQPAAYFSSATEHQMEHQGHRQLKTVRRKLCSEYKVVELAVAAESSFCWAYGGGWHGAVAAVQRIVGDVSAEYEMNGLCYKVQASHIEVWCDWRTDPYRSGVAMNKSGCGDYGLLQYFQNYWNRNRAWVKRDMAQLFSGSGLERFAGGGSIIGCAYIGTTCNYSAAYGVNYVTYTGNTVAQANLVAHEMGHVLGMYHSRLSFLSPCVNTTSLTIIFIVCKQPSQVRATIAVQLETLCIHQMDPITENSAASPSLISKREIRASP